MNSAMLDKCRVRRAFERAANSYDRHAQLQREVCERLLERLDYIRVAPADVLDLGAGTGQALPALMRRYRKARIHAVDIAHAMSRLNRRRSGWMRKVYSVTADAEQLPYAAHSFDLVFSNMTLQWCNDLAATFTGLRRVMRPGACLLFTTFGPDTLRELRASWARVDDGAHVSEFTDMHDVGDLLLQAGFVNPVMDMEHITMKYRDVQALMSDLKGIGASNARCDRRAGLTAPGAMRRMIEAYETLRCDGWLPATWEVVYGHAWAPEGMSVKLDTHAKVTQ